MCACVCERDESSLPTIPFRCIKQARNKYCKLKDFLLESCQLMFCFYNFELLQFRYLSPHPLPATSTLPHPPLSFSSIFFFFFCNVFLPSPQFIYCLSTAQLTQDHIFTQLPDIKLHFPLSFHPPLSICTFQFLFTFSNILSLFVYMDRLCWLFFNKSVCVSFYSQCTAEILPT